MVLRQPQGARDLVAMGRTGIEPIDGSNEDTLSPQMVESSEDSEPTTSMMRSEGLTPATMVREANQRSASRWNRGFHRRRRRSSRWAWWRKDQTGSPIYSKPGTPGVSGSPSGSGRGSCRSLRSSNRHVSDRIEREDAPRLKSPLFGPRLARCRPGNDSASATRTRRDDRLQVRINRHCDLDLLVDQRRRDGKWPSGGGWPMRRSLVQYCRCRKPWRPAGSMTSVLCP